MPCVPQGTSTGTSALPSSVKVLASRTRRKVLFSCTRDQIWVMLQTLGISVLLNYICIWCNSGLYLLFWAWRWLTGLLRRLPQQHRATQQRRAQKGTGRGDATPEQEEIGLRILTLLTSATREQEWNFDMMRFSEQWGLSMNDGKPSAPSCGRPSWARNQQRRVRSRRRRSSGTVGHCTGRSWSEGTLGRRTAAARCRAAPRASGKPVGQHHWAFGCKH